MPGFSYDNLRLAAPPEPALPNAPIAVDVPEDDNDNVTVNPKTKVVTVKNADATVTVYLDGAGAQKAANDDNPDFYENLADSISSDDLGTIATELLIGIRNDEDSRQDWLEARAEGMKLLALKLEDGKPGTGTASSPVEGMSRFRHPLLLEAVIRGHANARAELLPTDGPVKVRNDDNHGTEQQDDDANCLERDMNHYLTAVDKSYYPDTSRALWWTFFGGCAFKKVYHNPIKRRPVSESIDAVDIIVGNGEVDIQSAPRVTHAFKMRRSMLKRMQILKAYRDVDLGQPEQPTPNSVQEEKESISGITPTMNIDVKDLEYELFECYCELDIPGLKHKTDGEADGLAVPYKVTLDKKSEKILEVRRNWREDDDLCLPKIPFVKYTYIDAIGFYGIGLAHCLGSITNAITALARESIDTGMFANFPGGLMRKGATRQNQSQFRPAPGEFVPMDLPDGSKIQDSVMALPYKDVSPGMFQMTEMLVDTGTRLGGTAEIQVGEGKQDAPVGTTIALIEQATKPLDAVHKGLHASQQMEFELLVECIREDPQSFIKSLRRPSRQWEGDQLVQALQDYDLVPVADPNTSSRLQRIGKAQTVYQMAQDNPGAFNQKAVYDYVGDATGIGSMDHLLNQNPNATPPDPKAAADQAKAQAAQLGAQADLQDSQTKAGELALKSKTFDAQMQNDAAERQEDLAVAATKLKTEQTIHAQQNQADLTSQVSAQQHERAMQQTDVQSQEAQHMTGLVSERNQGLRSIASDHALQAKDHDHQAEMQKNAPKPAKPKGGK